MQVEGNSPWTCKNKQLWYLSTTTLRLAALCQLSLHLPAGGADKSCQTTSSWPPASRSLVRNVFELCSPSVVSWHVINLMKEGELLLSILLGTNFRIEWNVVRVKENHDEGTDWERKMSLGLPQQLHCSGVSNLTFCASVLPKFSKCLFWYRI